jgi:hypothetical protein
MKTWRRKFVLLAPVCVLVSFVTVVVLQRENVSALLYHPGPPARDVRDEDRKFLDNLVQKQKQDEVLAGNSLSDTVQNIGKAARIGPSDEPAPKAELVVNSGIVRRGELVVHGGTIKRAELVQPRH